MTKKDPTDERDLERILSLYEEKSKSFIRSFSISLGVAIFFLFIVFIPYVSIIDNKYQTAQDLNNSQIILNNLENIQYTSKELQSRLNSDIDDITKFYEEIFTNFGDNMNKCLNNKIAIRLFQITEKEKPEIERYIKNNMLWKLDICNDLGVTKPPIFNTILHFYLNTADSEKKYPAVLSYGGFDKQKQYESPALNKTQISMLEYFNSSWMAGSKFWIYDTNENKIQPILVVYDKDIDNINGSINHINDLRANVSLDSLRDNINGLRNNVDSLRNVYLGMPTILYEVFKLSIHNNNQNSTGELLDKYYKSIILVKLQNSENIFNDINRIAETQLKNNRDIETSLKENMKILQIKENETAIRLKEIEFPFGKIPIGINESISLFPIVLSFGFLIYASLFVDTALLRKYYHKHRLNGLEEKKKLEEKIALIAPLWVDSLTSLSSRITKLIILLSPLIIFVVSIYFIFHSWHIIVNDEDFADIFIGNSKNNMMLYVVSYIISSCFFIYGSWKIIHVIYHYNDFLFISKKKET